MPRESSQGGPGDRERMQHMLDAARDVATIVSGKTIAELDSDMITRRALLNALQEIGEAAARVGDEGRRRTPTLAWGKIVATRNILVHVYWGVDHEQIWKMATINVPEMIAALEAAFVDWPMGGTTTE
ncbi:MAG: DUF86 domain-containing protein [Phycisphaerales bacterium]|nr:DUF86 domain-containing protein [Phycisphaerales bacterium]